MINQTVNSPYFRSTSASTKKPKLHHSPQKTSPSSTKKTRSNWKRTLLSKIIVNALLGLAISPKSLVRGEPWNRNVQIFGSISQEKRSILDLRRGSYYTQALSNTLKNPLFKCLGEAQNFLQSHGYTVTDKNKDVRFPVSSDNTSLNTWCSNEKPQNKFILLISGFAENKKSFRARQINLNLMKSTLNQKFPFIPQTQINIAQNITKESLQTNLQNISREIDRKNIKAPELLIYYTGHGNSEENLSHIAQSPSPSNIASAQVEGAHKGLLALADPSSPSGYTRISEDQIKHMFKTILNIPELKVTFILDTCRAGAWIA